MVRFVKRLITWGYYLSLANRHARISDKWADLYMKNGEVTALDVSGAHVRLAAGYLDKAEEVYS